MADPRRPDRVAEAIREQVATFLAEGAKDPRIRGFVTVTAVEMTRDLRHANVFVSVMGNDDATKATFEGLASVPRSSSSITSPPGPGSSSRPPDSPSLGAPD